MSFVLTEPRAPEVPVIVEVPHAGLEVDAEALATSPAQMEERWAERVDWIEIGGSKVDRPATALQLGYRIDRLTALMVTMVTVVGSAPVTNREPFMWFMSPVSVDAPTWV